MKDINEVDQKDACEYVGVVPLDVIKKMEPISVGVGDYVIIRNKRYKIIESKKLDFMHRPIPALSLVSSE